MYAQRSGCFSLRYFCYICDQSWRFKQTLLAMFKMLCSQASFLPLMTGITVLLCTTLPWRCLHHQGGVLERLTCSKLSSTPGCSGACKSTFGNCFPRVTEFHFQDSFLNSEFFLEMIKNCTPGTRMGFCPFHTFSPSLAVTVISGAGGGEQVQQDDCPSQQLPRSYDQSPRVRGPFPPLRPEYTHWPSLLLAVRVLFAATTRSPFKPAVVKLGEVLMFRSWRSRRWDVMISGVSGQLGVQTDNPSQGGSGARNPPAGDTRDAGSIPGLGGSPGEGNGHPLQSPCLRTPWTEEPGGLMSMGWQSVGQDSATEQ